LTDDLPERAFRSHTLLALDYLAQGDAEAARQTLMNLTLMDRLEQADAGVYRQYLETVSHWQALQDWLATPAVAAQARQALWGRRERSAGGDPAPGLGARARLPPWV